MAYPSEAGTDKETFYLEVHMNNIRNLKFLSNKILKYGCFINYIFDRFVIRYGAVK